MHLPQPTFSFIRRSRLRTLLLIAAGVGLATSANAAVMISQVYGGGGNSGAPFSNDYVELHNDGSAPVSVAGWSLQYASATGSSWTNSTALTGSVPAGGYFLIRLAAGAGSAAAVPTPDVIGTTNMSATAGKLALVNNAVVLTGTCPLQSAPGAGIVDFVGFGSTASCSETAPAPAGSNTMAIVRANGTVNSGNSCLDTNNNSTDFSAVAPNPRNSAAPAQPCGGSGGGGGGDPVAAAIYTIQGSGATSPLVGQTVITSGVVTRINSNGFFIQDLTGDNELSTSDGIFVFSGSTVWPAAVVGNLVQVSATVTEFVVGTAADVVAHPVTELTAVSAVLQTGSGYSITPTVVALPEAVDGDLERYEGMLVTLTGPLTVNQNFYQARYGQLTLAVGGRLETPTNRHRPGSAEALALADSNARRRIVLDDGSSVQYPNSIPDLDAEGLPRAGYTTGAITGVIDYGLATNSSAGAGDYKIHPTVAPTFVPGNVRTAAPASVGGNVKVASFNVLNYFTAFTDGGGTSVGCMVGGSTGTGNCRGADNAAEFARQQAKIVAAMAAIDADAFGLMEIQNNGNVAAANLAAALNASVGPGTYGTTSLPADTGSDAIRVAMIYKTGRLQPVGAAVSDNDPVNNRPTLAQTFGMANGERFTLFVNHLKSKGSCPAPTSSDAPGNVDSGDGQGCWNALRKRQAERLRSFVAQRQAATGSNDVLLIGDFNAYAQEDPIYNLTSSGYVDQVGRFAPSAYSYVFDGAAGRLDGVFASVAMAARVTGVTAWHVDADEPELLDYAFAL
ncbi:MAG: ExeM/NucH family extracellular endonuclease, partial [Rubrivivax sp.]